MQIEKREPRLQRKLCQVEKLFIFEMLGQKLSERKSR